MDKTPARRKPRPDRMYGPKSCCCVFDAESGLCLRVLPSRPAAENWRQKHFPENPDSVRVRGCASHAAALRVFDEQMKIGLVDANVIDDLLWYGGISTAWKPPKGEHGR